MQMEHFGKIKNKNRNIKLIYTFSHPCLYRHHFRVADLSSNAVHGARHTLPFGAYGGS